MSARNDTGRLSQISTMWTEMVRARGGAGDDARAVAAALIDRYQEAAYGYLLTVVRDPDRATELFQEFALRFLRGDFKHFDPDRGRFRDYLRAVLINLVRGSYGPAGQPRTVAAAPDQLADPAAGTPDPDDSFVTNWRQALLASAWRVLEQEQAQGGPPYFAALRARVDRPDCPSAELAAALTVQLRPDQPFTDAGVRKLLQRGRELFIDRVVEEVARSVPTRDPDRVARELIDLGFYWFCKKALARWRA
jgi:RNA polymerase sigma-70 factor (ECF subfamily)